METYFPQVWEVWRKAQDSKALNCDIRILEAERGA